MKCCMCEKQIKGVATPYNTVYQQLYREWEEGEKKRKLEDNEEFIAKHRD